MKYKAIKEIALKTALGYLEKDPEKNMPKLMNWVDKLAGTGPDSFESQRAAVRAVVEDPTNNMHQLILNLFNDVDRDQLKTFFTNFILNANILGWPIEEEYRKKYNCNIPWVILLDPTSACNLHCTGCWAAEYGNKLNLSFDEIDSIITQGKEMGVYFYIYTGGEPLVRKEDLIKICRQAQRLRVPVLHQRHPDRRSLCRSDAAKWATLCPPSASRALKRPPTAAGATAPIRRSSMPWKF